MEVPISPDLMKSYRDTLQISDAPSFIETKAPIQPVAIIAQTSSASISQYVRLTDGTDTVAVGTDGSIGVSETGYSKVAITNAQTSSTTTVRTDTYTVGAGKYWILKAYHLYRAQAADITMKINTDGTARTFIYGATGSTLIQGSFYDMKLSAADAITIEFGTGVNGLILSVIYYEEYSI